MELASGRHGPVEKGSGGAAADPIAVMRTIEVVELQEGAQAAIERSPTGEIVAAEDDAPVLGQEGLLQALDEALPPGMPGVNAGLAGWAGGPAGHWDAGGGAAAGAGWPGHGGAAGAARYWPPPAAPTAAGRRRPAEPRPTSPRRSPRPATGARRPAPPGGRARAGLATDGDALHRRHTPAVAGASDRTTCGRSHLPGTPR